jgi:hypothetical protein
MGCDGRDGDRIDDGGGLAWLGLANCPAPRKEEVGWSSVAEERREPSRCSPAPADGSSTPRQRRPTMEDDVAAWLLGGDGGVDDWLQWHLVETYARENQAVSNGGGRHGATPVAVRQTYRQG